MAKKRTGLDALREYEARSGRQTQSEAQTEGSSGGAWRSGLDALRQFEANGGGRNVKNGEFNPNYRTMTRAMYESAYERYKRAAEAQERYSRAADAVGSSPVGGYIRAMRPPVKQPNFAEKTVEHDQESGQRRTQYELRRQIDQLEKARDYALSMQAGDPEGLPELRGAYDAVNAGRTKPMTLTEMDDALREKRYRRAVLEKSVSGRLGEYVGDLGRGVFQGGFEQAMTGFESVMGYLEQGANGAAAWALRDLAKAVPDGGLKDKMLALADDFSSYYTGESMTSHEEMARLHRRELEKLEAEIADKYKGVPLWIQQQMPSLGNMLFGAGLSGAAGVNNLATLGVTAGGNSALDAKDKGASDAQALAYGVVAGGLEVLSEKLFGGNPIYDTDAGLVNKAVGKLTDNKTIMKILNSKAFDIASEGLEEVVTEVLDPVAEWAIYNGSNTEFADAASIGNAFLGGVFLSVVGNVADAPNQIRQARYERVLRTAGSELADIAQTVDSAPVQEAAQVIRDKIAYGVTPDAADIGAVLDAIDQAGETVDVEQVREAVTAEEGAAETAQREANFQAYSRYAEERDARARDAEEVSQVRAQEYTEAINDAEADAADAAFEKLNKAEVSGALDAQARWQAEDARAERQFEVESREDTDRALSEAAQRYGYDERMTSVLLSGYSGAQSTQQYAEAVNAAYEYGKSGMSRTAAQRAAQGIDKALADEAWSAGKEIANGEKAGAARPDDGGKRNAGMDSGKQAGAVAGSAGGTAARSAAGRAVAERIGLENRVSAAGQPYLSGKDIGLSKGSAQRSFREAPQSTWTDGMKAAAGTLRGAGFTDVHFTVGSISVENQRAKVTRYADGVAAGNSVWVNATAKKWSVQQLADHEAFHRQVQDTPGLLDSVRAVLADELGDSGIRELAQRYAEAYEGCYDGEELDAYIEEICADAYAGMDRLPEEKARIIQKAARQAQDAQQAAEENGGTRGPPEKYSYAGELARTADSKSLARAEQMEENGASAEDIFRETGWFKGADGQWRFEIDDSKMEFRRDGDVRLMEEEPYRRMQELSDKWAASFEKGGEELTEAENAELEALQDQYVDRVWEEKYEIQDFLKHDDLYRAYPKLRHMSLIFRPMSIEDYGYYSPKDGAIVMNSDLIGAPEKTLIHEIQHIIQSMEGFARGASPKYWNDRMEEGFSKKNAAGEEMLPNELYRNTAGEIEARDVAERRNLSAEERRNRMPDTGNADTVFAEAGWQTAMDYDPETASIKEQVENSREALNAMDVVARASVPTNLKTKDSAAAWAAERLKSTGYRIDRQGYGEIYFSKKDMDKGLRYADTAEEKAALAVLPQVLKRGIEIGDHANHKNRAKQTVTFAAPVELNGTRGNMAVVVNRNGNHYYAHRIVMPDGSVFRFSGNAENAAQELSRGVTVSGSLADTTSAASTDSIRRSERESQEKFSASEEVSEADAGAEGSELQVEKLPQANRDQFMRFATKITDDLVTPLTAQMETLRKEMRPRVLELVDEFLENDALKRSSVEAVFEEAYDRALELNREFSEKYATLQYTIRKTPVTFTEEDTRRIEQYDYFDEAALRKLTIKEKGGASIGELYSDLSGMLPELFPSGIKNPAKQIMRIASVYKRISKAQALAQQVDSTNPEYFRENAYNDFLEQLRKIVPKMRTERELAQISIEEEAKMEAYMAERERRIAEEDARLAEEEAAKAPPEVYESLTMDSIPKKAQDYLRRVRGQTAAAIQQTLSMPFAARQEVLKPAIEGMMNEYLQTGRISQETVDRSFEESYRRGVEMDTEFYDEYKDVKTRLRDLKVTLSETDRADIADFNDFRRAAFGRLRIADEGGLPVDVAYKEMQQMAPELFPASVTHPADQLMQMFEVSKRIERVQRSLDEFHGEEAEEFKRWAKNDYEASVENMLGSLRVARRYAEARMRQKQARAVPTTMDEVKGLYAELKRLRRTYERTAAKNLLTAEDNNVLNRLLRGDLAPEDVQGMENAKGILAMYEAKADYDETAAKIADWRRYQKAQRLATADAALKNADQAKDKAAGIQYSRETMTRNVRDIFPEADAEIINRTYFEPVRTASANANKLKNQLRGQVKALDLSRKARKGDAVSEAHAVQLLGEAQDNIRYLEQHPRAQDRDGKTLDEWHAIVRDLWATSPGLDRAKIENAVETFRKIYDGLFEQMNDVRIRNGYEPINYRQGYFPHFQPGTTDGILGLMGKALGIDAEVSALPTTISGLTHTFKPGITYFGNALERIGFDTAYDAVEGFDKYVEGAASVICYTDVIQNLRALAQQVRYRTSDEGLRERVDDIRARDDLTEHQKELEIKEIMDKGRFSLSNFAVELDEYTNLLANKKSKYDRGIEHLAGRKVYNLLKAWENRVAANMVAVNPASWLTNFGVITQAGAQLKTTSVLKAMGQTLKGWTKDDGFVERSDFLVNRRGSDPLVRTWQQSASAVLSKPMDWIDTFSADTIVRARYMENIARGMSEEEAMREADDFAANVMADRSKGAMPTLFEARNPLMKMFTQFQLEVNNTYSYLFKDLPREQRKKGVRYLALALFKFLIGGYLYNEVYEYLIGRRPMLDPLGIVNDTVGDLTGYELNNLVDAATGGGLIKESEPESAVGTIQNLAENVGQEAPFIGNLMGGGKLPFSSSMPNVKNILTALDSETATDEEKLAKIGKEMVNPAAYWLLPFGGGQIKKMWQGISALKRQGSYTADGRLQYPIYTDRKGDMASAVARTMLFGKSATPEAQAWVEAGFGALSEKATQTYEAMRAGGVDQRDSYELIKAMSKVKKTERQTKEQLQMQLLNAFDIEDSGKVLYYYNMMASDKEKAQIDKLLEAGADVGEYLRYIQAAAGVTGEKDADGKTISGSVKDETLQLIDGLDLTPEQKTALAADSYTMTGFEPWTENHDRLYKAVSTGKDLRSTLKELEKAGYEPKVIREAITEMFREEYLAADTAGKARLKGYLRNAFMVSGLSKKEAENKIKKWEEAQK